MTEQITLNAWLDARGLDIELAAKMGWEQVAGRNGQPVLSIPYIDRGKEIKQFRDLTEKRFRFQSGVSVALWNADCLRDETLDSEPLVICEGAFDGLACMQSGFIRTIAVPGWSLANYDPANYKPFLENEEYIKRARQIVVFQHDDEAGAAMLRAVANFFDEADVRFVQYPAGSGDANDVLLALGEDGVKHLINNAQPCDPPGGLITGFSDMPPIRPRRVWKLNWPEFDKVLAFRTREISVMTGIPGSGKTTFATWLSYQLVKRHDLRIGIAAFETEGSELLRHFLRTACVRSDDPVKYPQLLDWLDRHYRIVHRVDDEGEEHGMLWLKRIIHKLCARDGCNLIIVDPWNEIDHLLEPGENWASYLNVALARLRQWANRYDAHLMILAHPKKLEANKKPSGYDIADGAAWANKPGMGYTVHLEDDDIRGQHVSLTTWKVRSRQDTGCKPSMLRMQFDENTMTYRPI